MSARAPANRHPPPRSARYPHSAKRSPPIFRKHVLTAGRASADRESGQTVRLFVGNGGPANRDTLRRWIAAMKTPVRGVFLGDGPAGGRVPPRGLLGAVAGCRVEFADRCHVRLFPSGTFA